MTTMDDERMAREGLVAAIRRLDAAGLNHGSAGNVSCRFAGGLLISPTGATAEAATPETMVHIDFDGRAIGPGIPSSEWEMHAAILTAVPTAEAVVHTHGDACVALSCLRQPLPAFHYMVASFGGDDVPCAAYATFGTTALAQAAVAALAERSACLLANHGMICHATSLERAVAAAVKLETLVRQYLLARQSGDPVLLAPEEMARVRARYGVYGRAMMPRA